MTPLKTTAISALLLNSIWLGFAWWSLSNQSSFYLAWSWSKFYAHLPVSLVSLLWILGVIQSRLVEFYAIPPMLLLGLLWGLATGWFIGEWKPALTWTPLILLPAYICTALLILATNLSLDRFIAFPVSAFLLAFTGVLGGKIRSLITASKRTKSIT